ncbi:hypothetical protein GCM10022249_24360 [Enteractinococcus coprophilus]
MRVVHNRAEVDIVGPAHHGLDRKGRSDDGNYPDEDPDKSGDKDT